MGKAVGKQGFVVSVEPAVVRRGDVVEVTITHTKPHPRGVLELGVVCREWFEEQDANDFDGWVHKVVYRDFRPIDPTLEARATFTIPAHVPFTYLGESVRYRWEVYASVPMRLRPDRRETLPIEVLP